LLNKSKPNTAETSLLVSIVEAPVYAMKSQYKALSAHRKWPENKRPHGLQTDKFLPSAHTLI
jgi:hypothetical protein